jgi:outer membrane usher protein
MSRRKCVRSNKTTIFFFILASISSLFFFVSIPSAGAAVSSTSTQTAAAPDIPLTEIAAAFPPLAKETTQIVVNVSVNGEPKGDLFVELDDEGNLYLKAEDLVALKLRFAHDRIVLIRNERFVPVSALREVRTSFDEKNLVLAILGKTAEAKKTDIAVFPLRSRPENVYYPRETSAFLNYGLTYAYAHPLGFQSFTGTNKIGARTGDVFFVSDSLYTKTEASSQFVRLQSSATYERRNDLQWLVLGDQFANSGDLGSSVNIGGLGFSKVYKIDPYFITQPVFNLQGVTALPSQADIYMDGVLVSKQQIAPGAFDLKNIYSYTGAHTIDVVLRDPFGNEQKISYPLYYSAQLLREGLHEYSYNVGFLREKYGVASDDYGKSVFSAFHRYGVTSSLNIGARAEGSDGVYNGGLSTSFLVPRAGAFTLSAAESDAHGIKGSAGSFQHSYQIGSFNTNLLLRAFSRDYATVSTPASPGMARYEASVGAGASLSSLGGIFLGYSKSKTYSDVITQVTSASYSAGLSKSINFFATASATRTTQTTYSFFVGLNINLSKNMRGAAQYTKTEGANTETVQIQKDIPVGEGVGYRAGLSRADTGASSAYSFNPFVQYNAPYGIYSVDSSVQHAAGSTTESYAVSAAGAFVYAGGFAGITRPVSDSFGIIVVDSVPDVTVLNNGQEIGKTDASGTMVVPTLTSYNQNRVTVDTKNVPIDYSISGVNASLSPSLWSGSCVAFDAVKIQAITGSLLAAHDAKKEPVEYQEGTITVGTNSVPFLTGKGGEFYVENTLPKETKEGPDPRSCRAIAERRAAGGRDIKPGTYPASIDYEGRKCVFQVTFPKTDEVITDLGQIVCELQKASIQTQPTGSPKEGGKPPVVPAPEPVEKPAPPPAPPAAERPRIQPPPAPGQPNIPSKEDLPLTVVVRPRINFDVSLEPNGRLYTRTNVGDFTTLLVKCNEETRLVFTNVGDDIVKNVCPDQGGVTVVITREEREALSALVRYLLKNPGTAAEIEGHADRHGSDGDAQRLGMQLASIVKEYLGRAGVKTDRIRKVESLGRKTMLCAEETAACDVMNRRVVIRIVRPAA